jgi:asparagine synthase (glutamine-hydrolysing)
MCGIVGFITFRASGIPDLQILRNMRDTLSHRGPDDKGEYVRSLSDQGPFVFLGHRRLSIIDLAGGHQPLSNEDGTVWVTFNGEIYNFMEIRTELEKKGHRFNTHSDTEVIAHAYEEYGETCFQRFSGMFAIGIWDDRRRRLVLARDRIGKKPLYYSLRGETLIFASELKAIVADPGFDRKVDPQSFAKYLFFEYVPCPRTIYADVSKLPPASVLTWEKDRVGVKEYWSVGASKTWNDEVTEEEAETKILELLRASVRSRLISDVPLGIFLSGGIDSSAVAAFAQQEVPGKVKTFSIGFEDPSFDESGYARLVSEHLGTEHYEKTMRPTDLLDLVPRLPEILDEPMADASVLPTYLLSGFTRERVTVALGGDGGDELFAGYPTYLAHRLAGLYERVLGPFHPGIQFLGNLLPVSDDNISFDFKVKKFLSGIGYPEGIRNYTWLGSFGLNELTKILSPGLNRGFDRGRVVEEIASYERKFPSRDKTKLLQYLDLKLYLQEDILVKVDRASMACSLEVRAPFLDHEFVEYVMNLPTRFKLRGLTSKHILKKAMRHLLPADILGRKKKGFGVPIAKWVKGPLRNLFEELLSSRKVKEGGFLNPDYVAQLLRDHLADRKDNRKLLWTLLIWQLWVERYRPSL